MNNVNNTLSVKKYIFSFIVATVVTLSVMGICAVIFSFFPPSEKVIEVSGVVLRCFSAFSVAFLCARVTKKKGLLTGAVSAIIYEFIIFFPSVLMHVDFSFAGICILFVLSAAFGAIGGVLAINLK